MFTRVLTDTWTSRPSFLPSLTSGTNLTLEEKDILFGGAEGVIHRDWMPPMRSNRNVRIEQFFLSRTNGTLMLPLAAVSCLMSALAVHGSVLVTTKVKAEASSTVCVSPSRRVRIVCSLFLFSSLFRREEIL